MMTLTLTCNGATLAEILTAIDDATRFMRLGIRNGADTGRYHFRIEDAGMASAQAGGQ